MKTPAFDLQIHNHIAVFRCGDKPLFFAADLTVRDRLLEALRRCSQDISVRAVVLEGFPEKAGSEEYERFFALAMTTRNAMQIHRMLNVFNQFIVAIVNLRKIVVFADSGRIISQFFNVGLACDYRIITDTTVIEKEYLRRGLLPKGGGALFLSRLLGPAKAYELLLSDEALSAQEALRLGLVNQVVSPGDLSAAGLAVAERFAAMPSTTVEGVKRLINYDLRELPAYLDNENEQLLLALQRTGFSRMEAGV